MITQARTKKIRTRKMSFSKPLDWEPEYVEPERRIET